MKIVDLHYTNSIKLPIVGLGDVLYQSIDFCNLNALFISPSQRSQKMLVCH